MHQWLELLEGLALPSPDVEPAAVAAWIRKRQKIVNVLQGLDASGLSEAEKATLRHRLDEERQRGEAVIGKIRAGQKALREQVVKAAQGRSALRGYRTAAPATPKTHGRTA